MTEAWERKSWQEVRPRENDLAGMLFPEGWLTYRIIGTEHVPIAWANFGSIAAGAAASPTGQTTPIDKWMLTVNNQQSDVFYHEWERVMYYAYIGVSHPLMQFFREFPMGNKMEGLRADIGKFTLTSTAASLFGWKFWGAESPYSDPRAISQEVIPYKTEYASALFNFDSHAASPQVNVQIVKALIQPFDPADKEDQPLIADILRRRVRAHMWTPGLSRWNWGNDFRKVYGVNPVVLKGRSVVVKGPSGATPMEVV